jgi:hypothetical protein
MGMKRLDAYRAEMKETERGDVLVNKRLYIGSLCAVLAQAKPDERERWHQLGHPVTHKLISEGPNVLKLTAGDLLMCEDRRFYIQSEPYDPGELGHWTIYYCEETKDQAKIKLEGGPDENIHG